MNKFKYIPLLILPLTFVTMACFCSGAIGGARDMMQAGQTMQAVVKDPTVQALMEQAPELATTAQAALQDPTVQALMEQAPELASTAQAVLKDPTAQAGIQAALTAAASYSVGVNNSDLPTVEDANVLTSSTDQVVYTTATSLADLMEFYRKQFANRGMTEREIATSQQDNLFSMVFDGASDGRSVSVQALNAMGQTTVTVSYIQP